MLTWLVLAAAVAAGVTGFRWARTRIGALERRLAAAARDLESLEHAFARFAPAQVVEDIIAQGISTRPERKEITVLFADLHEFTPLAERLDPDVLVRVLNGCLARLSQAVTAHRGHVAKFLGDGLLALFGALEPNPWQTNDAAHAALAMRAALARYNDTLAAEGLPVLALGVGIHRGTVVAGVMGSTDLAEYGVVGAGVNLAARVETLTRTVGADVLVTDAVRAVLDPRFRLRAVPEASVKGVTEPVRTFALEAFDGSGSAARG